MGGFFDFIQRIHQLAVAHFQLGDFQNQVIAAGEQGGQQLALGFQLRIEDAFLLVGQVTVIVLTQLAQRLLALQQVFIVQTLHAQLGHFTVELLWFGHIRQA